MFAKLNKSEPHLKGLMLMFAVALDPRIGTFPSKTHLEGVFYLMMEAPKEGEDKDDMFTTREIC